MAGAPSLDDLNAAFGVTSGQGTIAPTLSQPTQAPSTGAPVSGGADPASVFNNFWVPHEDKGGPGVVDVNGKVTRFGLNSGAFPQVNDNTTQAQAAGIWKTGIWQASGADKIANPQLAIMHADTYGLAPAWADRILPESGGDPAKYMALRRQAMANDEASNPAKFGPVARGWENRNRDLEAYSSQVSNDNGQPTSAFQSDQPTQPAPQSSNPAPPSQAELDAAFGVTRPGQPQAAPAAQPQPQAPAQAPIIAQGGAITPQGPPAPHVTEPTSGVTAEGGTTFAQGPPAPQLTPPTGKPPPPNSISGNVGATVHALTGQAAANAAAQDVARRQGVYQHPAFMNFVDALTGNATPYIAGAGAATFTGLQNAAAGVGIGHALPYTAQEAYDATRNVRQTALSDYQQSHPIANVGEQIAGFVAPGSIADLAVHAGTAGLAKVAPRLATSVAGRVATRAGATAGAAGVLGANQGISQGESAGGVALSAAENAAAAVPLSLAGEAVGGIGSAAKAIRSPVAQRVVTSALGGVAGGVIGAGVGAATGGDIRADAQQGAVTGLTMGALRRPGAAEAPPTASDTATALDMVAKTAQPEGTATPHTATAEALEGQPSTLTTAEALGPNAKPIIQKANPEPLAAAAEARQDPAAKMDRVTTGVQDATGIDPTTAKADVQAQIDAARAGPAKDAYDAALTGKPVWTPQLKTLSEEPEVAKAMHNAARLLGSDAFAPNPEVTPPTEGGPQERMSAAELRARMTNAGNIAPGQEVSTNDLMQYLKAGGPTTYSVAPKAPPEVPTDQMWDLTKQLLDKNKTFDAFGKPVPSTENTIAQHWSSQVRNALDDPAAIGPAYAQAREISGDYLSRQRAYQNGSALWTGKGAITGQDFAQRYANMTPAEQDATQRGYMAQFYQKAENNRLNPAEAQSPRHQAIQAAMFGPQKAQAIQDVLSHEQTLAAGAKGLASKLAKPEPESDHAGLTTGIIMGVSEHGLNLGAIARGAGGAAAGRGVGGVLKALQAGKVTPGVRNALGEILAQSPQETARQLRLARSAQRQVQLSKSNYATRGVARTAVRGAALAAGAGVANALQGVSH